MKRQLRSSEMILKKMHKEEMVEYGIFVEICATYGHYIGNNVILDLEAHSPRSVCFLLHLGSPHNSAIFKEVGNELKMRRITRIGDVIVFNKGYFSLITK